MSGRSMRITTAELVRRFIVSGSVEVGWRATSRYRQAVTDAGVSAEVLDYVITLLTELEDRIGGRRFAAIGRTATATTSPHVSAVRDALSVCRSIVWSPLLTTLCESHSMTTLLLLLLLPRRRYADASPLLNSFRAQCYFLSPQNDSFIIHRSR